MEHRLAAPTDLQLVSPAAEDARTSIAEGDLSQEDPIVSVIIPCYNGEAFLKETIQSALAQSYKNVEIIVVDDGSTDSSSEIAQAFPVRYIRQTNSGLTSSRNLGVRISKGSLIVFLDADDRLLPNAIQIGVAFLQQHPECAMTVGDHLFIAADGSFLSGSQKKLLRAAHYEALLKSNFIEMISSVLFRKSVLEEVGGFDTHLRVAEDYELYLRIARNHAIYCHREVVAEYRLHKANVSHNSELMLTMTLQVLQGQTQYVLRDFSRLFAFLEGTRRWRKQYGRQLAAELARSMKTLRAGQLRRKLLLLAGNYPQGLIILLLLRIMPTLGRESSDRDIPIIGRMHAWFNALS
jgi:glycosyltransferase involved in cell wall biosynthesis